jgi:hypothetical protein
MAVTAATPANLVVGAGDVKVDSQDVGATVDDNTFRVEEEIFEPDNLNGVPGMLVGTQYKTREEAILEASFPEISADQIPLIWPGSESDGGAGDVETFSWDGTRRLPSAAFHDYELEIPGLDGRVFSFFSDNALNQANAEFAGQDAGLMAPRGEFHSKWDAADLTSSPHRIAVTTPGS